MAIEEALLWTSYPRFVSSVGSLFAIHWPNGSEHVSTCFHLGHWKNSVWRATLSSSRYSRRCGMTGHHFR